MKASNSRPEVPPIGGSRPRTGSTPQGQHSTQQGEDIDKLLRRPRLNATGRAESKTMSREGMPDDRSDRLPRNGDGPSARGTVQRRRGMARSPFQAVRMVMAMPPEQQYVASIYLYDGDDESIITFTDIKEIAERADFPS